MPGGRARRHDRAAGRVDLSHHLVARTRPQGAREQRRAARSRLGPYFGADRDRTRTGAVLMAEGGARPRLFLDADGVLADFDEGGRRLLGMPPKAFEAKHGRSEFWRRIAKARNFYGS